ncbi:hypothetical protein MBLNU459_g5926t1 [Dothideomycetes sp. NU459]
MAGPFEQVGMTFNTELSLPSSADTVHFSHNPIDDDPDMQLMRELQAMSSANIANNIGSSHASSPSAVSIMELGTTQEDGEQPDEDDVSVQGSIERSVDTESSDGDIMVDVDEQDLEDSVDQAGNTGNTLVDAYGSPRQSMQEGNEYERSYTSTPERLNLVHVNEKLSREEIDVEPVDTGVTELNDAPAEDDDVSANEEAGEAHGDGCNGSPGASTPDKDLAAYKGTAKGNERADISLVDLFCTSIDETVKDIFKLGDVSKAHKADWTLHRKAAGLVPHSMPKHRYWIAVLMHDVLANNARKEKDFLWLKGNRLNTVSTIWHQYSATRAEDKFHLRIHDKEPDFAKTMEELNFYKDNLIVFQAVLNGPRVTGSADKPIELD